MGTTADKLEYLDGTKSAIKQAIVNKGVAVPEGTTFRAYAEKIGSIVKVPSLSNPGSAGDLRNGKQLAGADGSVITGTLAEVTQATPSISVSSSGLITASVTQSGGIVEAGSKGSTQQLTTQGAKTVTPTTTNQTAVASGRYTTGDVVVSGDANLTPENIAEGVSIFGVTGTHSGGGGGGAWYSQYAQFLKDNGDMHTLNAFHEQIIAYGDVYDDELFQGYYGVLFERLDGGGSIFFSWPSMCFGDSGMFSPPPTESYLFDQYNGVASLFRWINYGYRWGFEISPYSGRPCNMYVLKDAFVDIVN